MKKPRHNRKRSFITYGKYVGVFVGVGVLFVLSAGMTVVFLRSTRPLDAVASVSAAAMDQDDHTFGIAVGGALAYQDNASVMSYMQNLKQLGVTWVRFDFDWSDIQGGGRNTYNWSRYDRLTDAANRAGLHVLGIITYTPSWARSPSCTTNKCPPKDPALFGAFSKEVVSRYDTKGVHAWEMWNEPNRMMPQINPFLYEAMVKSAANAIRPEDPQAIVMSGGLARSTTDGSVTAPDIYLRELYQAGIKNYIDAVAIHPYDSSYVTNAGGAFAQGIDTISSVMNSYGDGGKQIWVTEFGVPTLGFGGEKIISNASAPSPYSAANETLQANMLSQVTSAYLKQPNMGPFFWYDYQDTGGDTSNAENFFGLVRSDGSKKPSYDVFKKTINNQ